MPAIQIIGEGAQLFGTIGRSSSVAFGNHQDTVTEQSSSPRMEQLQRRTQLDLKISRILQKVRLHETITPGSMDHFTTTATQRRTPP